MFTFDTSKLARKQRRALMFGSPEEKAKLIEELRAQEPPKTVIEKDGAVLLPDTSKISMLTNVLDYMIPYDQIDSKYKGQAAPGATNENEATDPKGYRRYVSDWFFKGLDGLKITFKPNLTLLGTQITSKDLAFKRYMSFILRSWDSRHEHKIAYAAYVCDMCCEKIEWVPAKRD
jgi:hypothetical protein